MIPYGKQDIQKEDIDAVIAVLKSDFLTQGPIVPRFESGLANIGKSRYATVVNSATSALHIACLSLGVGEGDYVWTVPNSFVASANCALYCGASVDFVDIDSKTNNMSIEQLEEKLISAKKAQKLPKVLIPVHLAGEPCDMAAIKKLSLEYNFKIIEDASHAIGGTYQGCPIGSCEYSDVTVFSFHPVKIVTSGEGGAVLTNSPQLDHKLKLLRSHGITRDQKFMCNINDAGWYYEQIALGFNYRMTDIHAALGLSQLSRLEEYINKRHDIANIYDVQFEHTRIQKPLRNPNNKSALHLYVIQVDPQKHNYIFHSLRKENIGVNLHYIPIHTQPYYQNLGFSWGDFPNSEAYYKKAISLPIYPRLSKAELHSVIDAVKMYNDD